MRSTFLLASFIGLLSNASLAQDCNNFYFLQKNKTVEMTIFNKKGEANGKQVYTISDVTNSGDLITGTVNSEMFDKKGKSIAKGHSQIVCNGGVMMIDMTMQLPQQQQEQFAKADVKADKIYIEYPNNMKIGDQLKDATLNMDIDNAGMKQNINMVTSNRSVAAKESVTTTAGTWDCFKITYKSKVTVKTMGIGMPFNIEGTEWFAPGFGIVKTESKYGGTAITAIK
ncbi:hypothetical protein A4H97_27675 [Niastella yeongjuensis]|uniref:DUF3108 domain-containing protein n=1 Tax=Niastella yeongjuensis TaxID=354355 RepID=A0A1V9EZ04_9BACT|nr:hypothetical protein [Niastella yeongjuensis]OQP51357.1 hypothetical protein A4H97_27675 [Niastella yeongjuensis]SEP38402.1 hypothetical protein SAMN05660816_05619 [Niastella yeongjuensis]